MEKNDKILNGLLEDLKDAELAVKNLKLYNFRKRIKGLFLKTGLALYRVSPYIFSLMVVGNMMSKNPDFTNKEKTVYANLENTVTSNGYFNSTTTFSAILKEETFFHTTGWQFNEDSGLWTRNETVYNLRLPEEISLENYEDIFYMSKEDIEALVKINDFRTISKKELSSDDYIYDEEAIVITFYEDDLNNYKIEPVFFFDVAGRISLYLLFSLLSGLGLRILIKKVFKDFNIPAKVEELSTNCKTLTEEERNELASVIDIRKNSLNIFDENLQSLPLDENSKVYSLTYKKGEQK